MIGVILLLVSLVGFNFTLRVLGAEKHLAWIISLLLQIMVLYIFAMLGALSLGLFIVRWLGVALFVFLVVAIAMGKATYPFQGTHLFDLWMLMLGGIMAKVLYNSPLIHYDNYTHWALIVKFMTFTGRLPNAHDAIVTYTSYPPATALFMTQVTKLLGFSEGAMLVGQFILIWAALYALFGVLRDKSRGVFGLALCLTIAISNIFNISIRMNNLLVDYVLPVLAAAGIAAIYIERERPGWQFGTVALISASILLVKNSGSFYVAIIAIVYATFCWKTSVGTWRQRLSKFSGKMVAMLGITVLPFVWWNWHVKTTFTLSKHEISAAAYKNQLAHETTAQVMGIAKKMIQTIVSGNSLSANGMFLLNITMIAGWLIILRCAHKRNGLLKTLVAIDLGFIGYIISLFGMYVLAMPYNEAKTLDGYERYMSSALIFGLFCAIIVAVVEMDKAMYEQRIEKRSLRTFRSIFSKNIYQGTGLVLLIFSIIMMLSETNGVAYANQQSNNALPQQLKRIATERVIPNHDVIALVDPHADEVAQYYTGYVGQYFFFSDRVVGQENWNMSRQEFKKAVMKNDYIAIPEWHRTFSAMVKQVWGQKIKTGLFKVSESGLEPVKPDNH